MAKKQTAGAKYFGKALTDDPDDAPERLNVFSATPSCVMATG
jgi:hypothetical protein